MASAVFLRGQSLPRYDEERRVIEIAEANGKEPPITTQQKSESIFVGFGSPPTASLGMVRRVEDDFWQIVLTQQPHLTIRPLGILQPLFQRQGGVTFLVFSDRPFYGSRRTDPSTAADAGVVGTYRFCFLGTNTMRPKFNRNPPGKICQYH
jgi:hypothetical protein